MDFLMVILLPHFICQKVIKRNSFLKHGEIYLIQILRTIQYYDDYVGNMEIYSLDRQNARRYGRQTLGMFS